MNRQNLAISSLFFLSACFSPQNAPHGHGFDNVGGFKSSMMHSVDTHRPHRHMKTQKKSYQTSEKIATSPTIKTLEPDVTIVAAVPQGPVLRQTTTGVPWLVDAEIVTGAPTKQASAESAFRLQENRRSGSYVTAIELDDSRANMRVVTLNGHDFGVIYDVQNDASAPGSAAEIANKFARKTAEMSGCTGEGPISIRRDDSGALEGYVVFLNC